MHKKFLVRDHDIFYLSYDEPNAEKNYADICNKIPWVKRVHGVKGSDAAHKACAERAETERFTTVDGDNIINPEWLDVEIDFDPDTVDLTTSQRFNLWKRWIKMLAKKICVRYEDARKRRPR